MVIGNVELSCLDKLELSYALNAQLRHYKELSQTYLDYLSEEDNEYRQKFYLEAVNRLKSLMDKLNIKYKEEL